MKFILPLLMMFPLFANAETATYEVSGMTCNSCVKAIKAKVCKLEGIEKCDVTVGKIVLSTKAGATLDQTKISEAVTSAGDYKLTGGGGTKK